MISNIAELVAAPPVPPAGRAMPKLIHLQIVRAIAASLVVFDHGMGVLLNSGFTVQHFMPASFVIGESGVDVFFILSGLIMVRQSGIPPATHFGSASNALRFAYRRVTRIVPLYWIAIATFLAIVGPGTPHIPRKQVLLSLFFIPDYIGGMAIQMPVYQPGWTLNYEMFFYLLFALALCLPRKVGLPALLAVCVALTTLGHLHPFPARLGPGAIFHFYTDHFLMLFAAGALLGALEPHLRQLFHPPHLPISPALLLLLPPVLLMAAPERASASQLFAILNVYGFLVILLCTLAPHRPPGRLTRALILLGDASYSTYLFNLLLLPPLAASALRLIGPHHNSLPAAMLLLGLGILLANLVGLVIHLALERPIIAFFRAPDHPR